RKVFEKLSPAPDRVVLANATEPHLDQSFFYLFDVASGLFEGAVAIAGPEGDLHVLSPALEAESARQSAKNDPHVEIHVFTDLKSREKVLRELIPEGGTIGLNERELTVETYRNFQKMFPQAKWTDASDALRDTRMIKDAGEIERIERAAQVASRAGTDIPSLLKTGMTEMELAAEIEYRMMRYGASGRSFSTIVGFGANSAEPHYQPQEVRLQPGMSMVCDFGALSRRYCSDITRSFRFGPRDDELKQVHEKVFEAQEAALAVLRAGVPGKEVHLAAQKVVDASPWKGRFNHGLGHALGLAVHDGGIGLSPNNDQPLQAGMVVTVEPGIYLPGHGGVRIEDDVVITESGYRFLTTTRREYLEVGA
ncbi:MAG: Xaa-Pro peptidase family protein, partial [Thermoplasmata archaeon]